MSDLRLPLLAAVVWLSVIAAPCAPGWAWGLCLLSLACVGWRRSWPPTLWSLMGAAGLAVAVALLAGAGVANGPVHRLAGERASVHGELIIRSDPHGFTGRFGSGVSLRAEVRWVSGRGARHEVRAPVLVTATSPGWRAVRVGSRVGFSGRLGPLLGGQLAGLLSVRGPPLVRSRPGLLLRAADGLRTGIRGAVAGESPSVRALLPALVDGDDGGMPAQTDQDFRTTGLTHLLAVSGTNLTLVVGFLLVIARWVGVRARGLMVVGGFGVAGFVLLARAEPSVVRAAAMGSVALLGMGSGGRARGVRALGAAVVVLLFWDPWLGRSPGFALSALATAGILFLAPGWRDAINRWCPRWAPRWWGEAIAVPLAAQLACTPLVAALSGQVSLVAVAANLAAAPAVGPATVLGLLGGVVQVFWAAAGRFVAQPGIWCAGWIVAVARRFSDLPVPAWNTSTSAVALTALTIACLGLAFVLGSLLARRTTALALACLMGLLILVPLPTPGWPPKGWVMAACDVGQGDGLLLNAGPGAAVVVDAGPDPRLMDRCLRRFGVSEVPLVVLTHFHADHVDGLPGVLHGRRVGQILTTPFGDPEAGARQVLAQAAAAHVRVGATLRDSVMRVGPLTWQVLAPRGPAPADSDSPPNDESVVLLVRTRGLTLLLMGDEETGSQRDLAAAFPGLHADVLKVAHHGSAKQDPDLIAGLGARLALISVGKDNDYGHPAPSLMALLHRMRIPTRRTDLDGDLAVVVPNGGGSLRFASRGGSGR